MTAKGRECNFSHACDNEVEGESSIYRNRHYNRANGLQSPHSNGQRHMSYRSHDDERIQVHPSKRSRSKVVDSKSNEEKSSSRDDYEERREDCKRCKMLQDSIQKAQLKNQDLRQLLNTITEEYSKMKEEKTLFQKELEKLK